MASWNDSWGTWPQSGKANSRPWTYSKSIVGIFVCAIGLDTGPRDSSGTYCTFLGRICIREVGQPIMANGNWRITHRSWSSSKTLYQMQHWTEDN
jgi:hypothetical protein